MVMYLCLSCRPVRCNVLHVDVKPPDVVIRTFSRLTWEHGPLNGIVPLNWDISQNFFVNGKASARPFRCPSAIYIKWRIYVPIKI